MSWLSNPCHSYTKLVVARIEFRSQNHNNQVLKCIHQASLLLSHSLDLTFFLCAFLPNLYSLSLSPNITTISSPQLIPGKPHLVRGLWQEQEVPRDCGGQQAPAGGQGVPEAPGPEGHQLHLRPHLSCFLYPTRGGTCGHISNSAVSKPFCL